MASTVTSVVTSHNDSNVTNVTGQASSTWQEGDLFTWHGAELILLPSMMVLGIMGNLLVFYIYHFRWRSNTVTLFKRMLAVLDLANLLLAMPSLLYITIHPRSSTFMANCVFTSFVALSTACASGCVLVIIATDRFMKLCLLRKTGVGVLLSKKLFAASVVGSGLMNIPCGWIFGRDTVSFYNYNVKVSYCFIHSDSKQGGVFVAYASMLGVVFLTVSVSLFVLYVKVVRSLQALSEKHEELKRRPSLAGGCETIKRQKQTKLMRKSAVVFIVITVVFFASYAPYFVTMIISMVAETVEGSFSPLAKSFYDLAKLSPLANNVANPFIYSFTSDHFREEVKNIFTFKSCKKGFFSRRNFSFRKSSTDRSRETSQDSREED